MNERPTGITIIAIVFIILAAISLVWSGLEFGVGGLNAFFGNLFGAQRMAEFGTSSAWSGTLGILTAVVQIVVAFGLLAMKKWAWILALVGVALTVIEGFFGMFAGGPFAFMCGTIGLIVPVIILIYLLRPSIRSLFGIQ